MASTRLKACPRNGQALDSDLVPDRMKLVDGWATTGESSELYVDGRAGDSHLILVTEETIEHVATFFHASGVLRATVWHGTGADRPAGWRNGQRRKAAATIALIHAESEGAAA